MKSPESGSVFIGKDPIKEEIGHGWGAVFFDLEDLLVSAGENNLWKRLFAKKGRLADHAKLKEKYLGLRNLKDRREWAGLECEILLETGLKKVEFDDEIDSTCKSIAPDTRGVVSTLHSWGYDTGIITGGIGNLAEAVRRELGMKKAVGLCNFLFDDLGLFCRYTLGSSDYEGKVDALEKFAREFGIPLSEVVYVGHGVNDRYAFDAADLSIAVIDPHSPEGRAGAMAAAGKIKDTLTLIGPRAKINENQTSISDK